MIYFDTSFLVPLFLPEATSRRVQQVLAAYQPDELATSHWTRVEFSSMLAREVRTGGLPEQAARDADAHFEAALTRSFTIVLPDRRDFDLCKSYLQQFDAALRAPDALHLAIASNHNAMTLYTLDKRLLRAGKLLRLPVEAGIPGRS
jgi:uncharacterized protein